MLCLIVIGQSKSGEAMAGLKIRCAISIAALHITVALNFESAEVLVWTSKRFYLVELLVVIGIIAVLVAYCFRP